MISTTIEQSKNLVKLGLSAKTADMHYRETKLFGGDWILCPYGISYYNEHELPIPAMYIPSWSLSALLNVMPKGLVLVKDSVVEKYHLFSKGCIGECASAENPIDACYNMLLKFYEKKLWNLLKTE